MLAFGRLHQKTGLLGLANLGNERPTPGGPGQWQANPGILAAAICIARLQRPLGAEVRSLVFHLANQGSSPNFFHAALCMQRSQGQEQE